MLINQTPIGPSLNNIVSSQQSWLYVSLSYVWSLLTFFRCTPIAAYGCRIFPPPPSKKLVKSVGCPPLAPGPMGEEGGALKFRIEKVGPCSIRNGSSKWLVPAGIAMIHKLWATWRTFDVGVFSATRIPVEMPWWDSSRVVEGRVVAPPSAAIRPRLCGAPTLTTTVSMVAVHRPVVY